MHAEAPTRSKRQTLSQQHQRLSTRSWHSHPMSWNPNFDDDTISLDMIFISAFNPHLSRRSRTLDDDCRLRCRSSNNDWSRPHDLNQCRPKHSTDNSAPEIRSRIMMMVMVVNSRRRPMDWSWTGSMKRCSKSTCGNCNSGNCEQ